MLQTLQLGDYIIANKAIYRYSQPQQGDIIVFKPPERALYDFQKGKDIDFVKRLIALPGQIVEIRGGSLYIDGQQVAEPYLSSPNEFDFKLVEVDGEYWPVQYNAAFVNPPRLVADEYVASTQEIQERLRNAPPAAIPDGYFLAMGDNRTGSFDSRGWGLAPLDSIIGRSEVVFWPPRHWKVTR
jgi:signal peptidase I